MTEIDESTMGEIRAFINSVEWRYAKTMPRYPHFYNVLEWNPEKTDGFFKLVTVIFNNGYKQAWPRPPEKPYRIVTYFNVDEYRYWVMSDTIEDVGLINRAKEYGYKHG